MAPKLTGPVLLGLVPFGPEPEKKRPGNMGPGCLRPPPKRDPVWRSGVYTIKPVTDRAPFALMAGDYTPWELATKMELVAEHCVHSTYAGSIDEPAWGAELPLIEETAPPAVEDADPGLAPVQTRLRGVPHARLQAHWALSGHAHGHGQNGGHLPAGRQVRWHHGQALCQVFVQLCRYMPLEHVKETLQ